MTMRPIYERITYPHPTFEGERSHRGHDYSSLLRGGHGFRPNAGLFDETIISVVEKGTVTGPDIKRILKAADDELLHTGRTRDIFHQELTLFYEEWGWAFDKAATAALKKELEDLPEKPPRLNKNAEPENERHVNALFVQAAIDGKITGREVDNLIAAENACYDAGEAFEENFRRLYTSDKLEFEKRGLVEMRARLDDPRFVAEIDFGRDVAKMLAEPLDEAGADAIIAKLRSTFEEMEEEPDRYDMKEFMNESLGHQGIKDLLEHPQLTQDARSILHDFFDGNGLASRVLRKWTALHTIGVPDVKELIKELEWADENEGIDWEEQAVVIARKLGAPYFEDPRFTSGAVAALDERFYGCDVVEARASLTGRDTLAVLEVGARHDAIDMDYTHGDPSEGDELKLAYSAYDQELSIEGLETNRTVTIGGSPVTVTIDDRELDREAASKILMDANLQEAVRALMHRAITPGFPSEEFDFDDD